MLSIDETLMLLVVVTSPAVDAFVAKVTIAAPKNVLLLSRTAFPVTAAEKASVGEIQNSKTNTMLSSQLGRYFSPISSLDEHLGADIWSLSRALSSPAR